MGAILHAKINHIRLFAIVTRQKKLWFVWFRTNFLPYQGSSILCPVWILSPLHAGSRQGFPRQENHRKAQKIRIQSDRCHTKKQEKAQKAQKALISCKINDCLAPLSRPYSHIQTDSRRGFQWQPSSSRMKHLPCSKGLFKPSPWCINFLVLIQLVDCPLGFTTHYSF